MIFNFRLRENDIGPCHQIKVRRWRCTFNDRFGRRVLITANVLAASVTDDSDSGIYGIGFRFRRLLRQGFR